MKTVKNKNKKKKKQLSVLLIDILNDTIKERKKTESDKIIKRQYMYTRKNKKKFENVEGSI